MGGRELPNYRLRADTKIVKNDEIYKTLFLGLL